MALPTAPYLASDELVSYGAAANFDFMAERLRATVYAGQRMILEDVDPSEATADAKTAAADMTEAFTTWRNEVVELREAVDAAKTAHYEAAGEQSAAEVRAEAIRDAINDLAAKVAEKRNDVDSATLNQEWRDELAALEYPVANTGQLPVEAATTGGA